MRTYKTFTPTLFDDVAIGRFGSPLDQLEGYMLFHTFDSTYSIVYNPVFKHLMRICLFRNMEAQLFWKDEILDIMCHVYEPRYPDDMPDDYEKRNRMTLPELTIFQNPDGSLCNTEYPFKGYLFAEMFYNMGFEAKEFDIQTIMRTCQYLFQDFYDNMRAISFIRFESMFEAKLDNFISYCNGDADEMGIPNYAHLIVDSHGNINYGLSMQRVCEMSRKIDLFKRKTFRVFYNIFVGLSKICIFPHSSNLDSWKNAVVDEVMFALDFELDDDTAAQDIKWHYFTNQLVYNGLGDYYEEYSDRDWYFSSAICSELHDDSGYDIPAIKEANKERIIRFFKVIENLRNVPPADYRIVLQQAIDDFVRYS